MRIFLDWARGRGKRITAVEFGNLPEVSEVVVGKFVQHLGKRNQAQFMVTPGACGRRGWHRMKKKDERPEQRHKLFAALPRNLLLQFGRRWSDVLCQLRLLFDHQKPRALLV